MSVKAPAICTRIYGRSSAARDATPKSSPRRCSAISTTPRSSLPKARAPLQTLAPRRRPSRPQDPKRRRSPSASRPRARPAPVPRAHQRRRPRRRTRRALTRPPHPRPVRVVVVSSSLRWSSISRGSLSLRRPNSSVSRTPPDSTQSPVAFRTTGSCARAAPNYTQPPSVETVGIVARPDKRDFLISVTIRRERERRRSSGDSAAGRFGGRSLAETLTLSNNCERRDGFRGRTLGERSEQSLTLKLSGGRADVLPAGGEKAAHQRVERRASVHGFSVSRGVREQKPFRCPEDAVGFGVEQLYLAELLNETANCFVSVVAGCAGAVHDVLSSGERFGRCSSTLREYRRADPNC